MKKLLKIVAVASLLLVVTGCSSGSSKDESTNMDKPYFEMLKDTAFTGKDSDGQKVEIVVKKGTALELVPNEEQLELLYSDVSLFADASNAKAVDMIPIQAVPMIISTELIRIDADVDLIDQDGNILMRTNTTLPSVNFIRVMPINGADHYEMVIGSRVVYIAIDDAQITMD